MPESEKSAGFLRSSTVSLALALLASAACFGLWAAIDGPWYFVAGLGFLIWSPVWYRSPILLKALSEPFGARVTLRRKFTRFDIFCVFIGQLLLLVAIALKLIEWYKA